MQQTMLTGYIDGNQNPGSLANLSEPERQALADEAFQKIGEIGAAFYEQGNYRKAREIFEELVGVAPNSSAAQAALGAVLTKINEDEKAFRHLNEAISLNPGEISAWVNRAELRLRQNQYEPALEDLKQAMLLNPTADDPAAARARDIFQALMTRLEQNEAGQAGKSAPPQNTGEKTGKTGGLRNLMSIFQK
ncbi:MAG: tetratricopeptide repeat protein [Blastocatellia bacterium]